MSAETNKALVRRFYEEIDKGNIDILDELVAEDYLDHNPPPFPGLPPGRAGLKQAFKMFAAATPGHHQIEDQIAEGDKVVTRLTSFGKHEGDLPAHRQRPQNDIHHHPPHRRRKTHREVGGERRHGIPHPNRSHPSHETSLDQGPASTRPTRTLLGASHSKPPQPPSPAPPSPAQSPNSEGHA